MVKLVDPPLKSAQILPSQFQTAILHMPFMPALLATGPSAATNHAGSAATNPSSGKKCSIRAAGADCKAKQGALQVVLAPEECIGSSSSRSNENLFSDAKLMLIKALLGTNKHDNSNGGAAAESVMEGCRLLQENLRVYALPDCVACAQSESLSNVHSACTSRQRAAQRMSFCAVCAANGKGFKGKLRMCCITGLLSCVSCQPGTVINASMTMVMDDDRVRESDARMVFVVVFLQAQSSPSTCWARCSRFTAPTITCARAARGYACGWVTAAT